MATERDPYWRRARAVKVIDGDTIQLVVDLGYYVSVEHRFRLLGVNTPERHAADPAERVRAGVATQFVKDWLEEHASHTAQATWPFHVRSEKSDSFGRFLALLECGQQHVLNRDLIESGHAEPFRG